MSTSEIILIFGAATLQFITGIILAIKIEDYGKEKKYRKYLTMDYQTLKRELESIAPNRHFYFSEWQSGDGLTPPPLKRPNFMRKIIVNVFLFGVFVEVLLYLPRFLKILPTLLIKIK